MADQAETKEQRKALAKDVAENEADVVRKLEGALGLGEDLEISLDLITVPGDKLLIQELDPHSVTPGGIHLPDMSKKKRSISKVLKLSPQLTGKKLLRVAGVTPLPMEIPDAGDYVTYAKYVTAESVMEEIGPRVCVLNFDDILAVLKPEAIENAKAEAQA